MAYPGKPKYTLLSPSDSDFASEPDASTRAPSTSRVSLALQTGTFLITIALLITLLVTPHASVSSSPSLPRGMNRVNPSTAHQLQPCGTDAATARAKGCIFDLLTLAWLAPECYDADLSEEFLEVASETFYYDAEGLLPIESYEKLSEREINVTSHTTRRYHVFHCAYGWRLMHKMLERGGMLESGLSGYHHTEHCTATLMNTSVPLDAVITRVEISYPDC